MSILLPHPILFSTPWGAVTSHSVFFALAMVVAAAYFGRRVARHGLATFTDGVEHAVWIIILALFGARLGYLVSYTDQWTTFGQLFAIWQGGLVSFWGIAVGLLVARWRGKGFGAPWWDSVVLAGLLGWSIGRIGNFYMGESGGVMVTGWQAFGGIIPIQLFEALGCLVLWGWLSRRSQPVAWLGIAGYFVVRFLVDIWRDEAVAFGLHIGQWVSLLALMSLTLTYVVVHHRPRP